MEVRCDLLAKCIFDVLNYNSNKMMIEPEIVVICLQNVSLMY